MRSLIRLFSIISVLFFLTSSAFSADTLRIDPVHSSVDFNIRHLVGRVRGRFMDFSGTIVYDQDKIANSSVNISIKTKSIDTGNQKRDGHLRTADFFDVENYPEITFQSNEVKETEDGFVAVGPLSIHGVEKEIHLPFEVLGFMKDKKGNIWAGFESGITINRKDFGITWNRTLEDRGFILGDEVKIKFFIESVMKKEEEEKKEEKEKKKE
ncbi:YceI family protein [candidate division TA06 bacterium]|nr:YceI family protein [candidate division TA06 bacterium]